GPRGTEVCALAAFAIEKAVQRAGQWQQFVGMMFAAVAQMARLDLVQLATEALQRTEAPGKAEPEQGQQPQQAAAVPEKQLLAKFFVQAAVFAGGLHGDETERAVAFATAQVQFDVVDEVFQA